MALVTFDRPKVHNALDRASLARFGAIVEALALDPKLLAVVVTGAGEKAFVAGGDLEDLHQVKGASAARELAERVGHTLSRLAGLDAVVIAAIGGWCIGGGLEIALACDLRIVAQGARLAGRQVSLGVAGGWGGVGRLVRLVGPAKALRFLLETDPLDAEDARALGLVDEVVPAGQHVEAALRYAERLTELPEGSVRLTKRAVRGAAELPPGLSRTLEAELFAATWASEAHEAAVRAFLSRRAAGGSDG